MLGATLTHDAYLARLKTELDRIDRAALARWADLVYSAWEKGRFVFIIGNGGSGTTASHMAEDLGKSTLRTEDLKDDSKRRLKVLSLTDNAGWIMAVGNDVAYDQIFVQQLMNYGSAGDVLLAISGSGNSPNILAAVEWANRHGLTTFGLTGYGGGKLKTMQSDGLHVALDDMGMVESIHLCLFHWVLNDVYARINREGRMADELFLGIEIGGTKLQLGVGRGDGSPLFALERLDVELGRGALGILEQIDRTAATLIARHKPLRIGIGFGGPVNASAGRVIKSHQVPGWEDIALGSWCQQLFGLPTRLGNDCDVAALAEARFGAGRGGRSVFFMTVGTGIGGGLVVEGRNYGLDRPAVAEIGHLRPGLLADSPESTVEALASGPGIAAAALARISGDVARPLDSIRVASGFARALPVRERLASAQDRESEYIRDLLDRCDNKPEQITAKIVARAAEEGNPLAQEILAHATQALGWAIAQMITLVAPETVVVGGGVSLMGETLFFSPLRSEVERYVFPPLRGTYRILPAALGEEVVVHGALALARG